MKTFEEALEQAKSDPWFGEAVDIMEHRSGNFAVSYPIYTENYQKLGWILRAKVRYKQTVELV